MTEDTSFDEEDLPIFLAALAALKAAEEERARKRDLQWFVMAFALLRRPREEHAALMEATRRSQADPQRGEELVQMMRNIAATWEEELLTRGRAEGEVHGELRARREDLCLLLEERFGLLPEAVTARIAAIDDAERLRNALRQAVHVTSLEELTL